MGEGTVIHTDPSLLRLFQLASAALPVGGYSFSQGMESAVEAGWLPDRATTSDWLQLQLDHGLTRVDLPLLRRQWSSVADASALSYWNATCLACRETSEIRLADTAMGRALRKLCIELEVPVLCEEKEISFVTMFAIAAKHWRIDVEQTCQGFAWAWLENQVAAATKLVPLGQTAAQQLLSELMPAVVQAVTASSAIQDEEIGGSLPGLALASCWHETQYSRLFRS